MELRQLRHFKALAEEQNFTRAAQRMHIVQSALSTSIRALEDALGTPLFVRTTRQVHLSPAGVAFLEKIAPALENIDQACKAVEDISALKRGRLGIGTVHTLSSFVDLPATLATFHHQYPDIDIELCQGSSTRLIDKLKSRHLDLAILPLGDIEDGIETREIACESLVLALPKHHPLAAHTNLSLSDIAGESFVEFALDWGTRKLIDRGFANAGIERKIVFEISDLETQLELVSRGLGVALVPERIVAARPDMLAMATFAEPRLCWVLVVAYLKPETGNKTCVNAAAEVFLSYFPGAEHVCHSRVLK